MTVEKANNAAEPAASEQTTSQTPQPLLTVAKAAHLAKAAELIEYEFEPGDVATPATPDTTPDNGDSARQRLAKSDAIANQAQQTPQKPAEPATQAKSEEPAEPAKPEKTGDTTDPASIADPADPVTEPTEPIKSAREKFMEKANDESVYRVKEDKLKEREAAAQALEEQYKAFTVDPVAYLEKQNPKFYEEMTQRILAAGEKKESSPEVAALKAELAALRQQTESDRESDTKAAELAQYNKSLDDGERLLATPEFDAVRESAAEYEAFTGNKSDVRYALAEVWIEYKQMYKKELTPEQCCEILLEDAQSHLARLAKNREPVEPVVDPVKPAEKATRKRKPVAGQSTLTNAQVGSSSAAPPPDYSKMGREERMRAIANTISFEDSEET